MLFLTFGKKNCLRVTNIVHFFNTKFRENESEDEGVQKRATSLLSAFKTTVTMSSWCEPKIISLLFEATKEQKFDKEPIEVMSACLTFRSYS